MAASVDFEPELLESLSFIPGLAGLVDESKKRNDRLEVRGTRLKKNKYLEAAVERRQLDSVISLYGTERWPELAEQIESEFEKDQKDQGFPDNVEELKEMLATPGNDIFEKKHSQMELVRNDYQEILGKGISGVVLKKMFAVDGKEDVYAVKVIPFSNETARQRHQLRYAVKEIQSMNAIEDQHIINLHDVYVEEKFDGQTVSPMLHLVMDCATGSYSSLLRSQEDESWDEFRFEAFLTDVLQMFVSVRTLHDIGIAHRDVKFGNFIYVQTDGPPILKLIDFGHADGPGIGGSFSSKELQGTPELVSPEMAKNFLHLEVVPNAVDGRYMDIWALGIMLYFLMVGDYPFNRGDTGDNVRDIEALCSKVVEYTANYPASKFKFDEDDDPMAFKTEHIINGLLHPNPRKRMGIDEAISELRHVLQDSLDEHCGQQSSDEPEEHALQEPVEELGGHYYFSEPVDEPEEHVLQELADEPEEHVVQESLDKPEAQNAVAALIASESKRRIQSLRVARKSRHR